MENRAYAFAVGLFTLLLGASVVIAAMWLSGETETRELYTLESRYPVTGLNVQAPVRFRGVDVGQVESIRFSPANSQLILVEVAVRSNTPLTRSTYAKLGSQGVTGLSYVILDDDGSSSAPLPPGDPEARIPVRPSFLHELTDSGMDLVSDVREVAARVNSLLDERNQAQLIRTLAALEIATNRVSELAVALGPAIHGLPAVTADARNTLARADEMLASLNALALDLRGKLGAIDRVARSAERVGVAAETASGAIADDALPHVNALLEDVARTTRRLDRLIMELGDQPASVVFGRSPGAPGPGEPGFDRGRSGGR